MLKLFPILLHDPVYKVQILIVGRITRVYTKKHEYTHVSIFQIVLCFI